jgi:hypothetical protein
MPAGWDQLRSRVLQDKDGLRAAMLARSVGAMIGAWQTEQPACEQPRRTARDGGGGHGLDMGTCWRRADTRRRAIFGHESDIETPEASLASGVSSKHLVLGEYLVAGIGFEPMTFRL